jgi:CubicO group peptidase (beta-lactamase class C family)
VVWTGVRGLADVAAGTRITPRTIFDAGSIAKQFTAAAVLLLAQENRLNLTDTLADHLDGFPSWAAPSRSTR